MILRNLFSAKQVGTLYHYTTYRNGERIVHDNFLRASKVYEHGKTHLDHPGWSPPSYYNESFVSFTRDSNFHRVVRLVGGLSCRFVVDGNRLSEHYKISPYNFFYKSHKSVWDLPTAGERNFHRNNIDSFMQERDIDNEMEEVVLIRRGQLGISDFLKYVIRLDYSMFYPEEGKEFEIHIRSMAPKLKLGVLL